MTILWQLLLRADLPNNPYDETHFTVLGLGDSAYEWFCWAARNFLDGEKSGGEEVPS